MCSSQPLLQHISPQEDVDDDVVILNCPHARTPFAMPNLLRSYDGCKLSAHAPKQIPGARFNRSGLHFGAGEFRGGSIKADFGIIRAMHGQSPLLRKWIVHQMETCNTAVSSGAMWHPPAHAQAWVAPHQLGPLTGIKEVAHKADPQGNDSSM